MISRDGQADDNESCYGNKDNMRDVPDKENDYSDNFILFVDDEEISLKYFKQFFTDKFNILTANSVSQAEDLLLQYGCSVAVAIVDQRMPEEKGNVLLAKLKKEHPAIIRLMTTAYTDLDDAIDAVNKGEIYRYITKPWDIDLLVSSIDEAFSQHIKYKNQQNIVNEKKKTMFQLAGTIAHELRTPLSTIYSASIGPLKHVPSLISHYRDTDEKSDIKISEKHLDALAHIDQDFIQETRHALAMIDILMLNISDIHSMINTDINSIVDTITLALEKYPFVEHQRTIVNFDQSNDFDYQGTEELIIHVFYNFIKNSIYAINNRGSGEIEIKLESGEKMNKIYFKDTGCGIASHDLTDIFDTFFSTKNSAGGFGIGIGLSFCQNVIHTMDGEIECKSILGEYTEFCISLPTIDKVENIIDFKNVIKGM